MVPKNVRCGKTVYETDSPGATSYFVFVSAEESVVKMEPNQGMHLRIVHPIKYAYGQRFVLFLSWFRIDRLELFIPKTETLSEWVYTLQVKL